MNANYIEDLKVYQNMINDDCSAMTRAEEYELFEKLANGKDIKKTKNRIISSVFRIVFKIAKAESEKCSVPFSDLLQSGLIGVLIAMDKYDYKRNVRFTTIATIYIKQEIYNESAANSYAVSLSRNRSTDLRKIAGVVNTLYAQTGRIPSINAIGDKAGVSHEMARNLMRYVNTVSLDSVVAIHGKSDIEYRLKDIIASKDISIDEAAINDSLLCQLKQVLAKCTAKERYVFYRRFWPNEEGGRTRKEIAKELSCTVESIRQAENSALDRVRKGFARKIATA